MWRGVLISTSDFPTNGAALSRAKKGFKGGIKEYHTKSKIFILTY